MNVEPGERLAEDMAVGKCALSAWTGREIVQPPLQTDNLPEPIDVAARNRQVTEPRTGGAPVRQAHRHTGLRRRLVPILCGAMTAMTARRSMANAIIRPASVQRDAERHQQTAEEDWIGQRVGRRLEAAPVPIQRGQ